MFAVTAFVLAFALLNRGRGSHFGNEVDSTVASRLITALGMSIMTMVVAQADIFTGDLILICAFAGISLWDWFGWDNYWSAAIGNPTDTNAPSFKPVDWLMHLLPPMPLRLWGTVAMGLRQSLAAPCIVGLAFLTGHPEHARYAIVTLLFGLPYLIAGYLFKAPVMVAEYAVGGALGFIIINTIQ